jgi:hypothetical protein
MSYLTQILISTVNSLTNKFNSIEANAKKIDELPAQDQLDINSRIHVSLDGESQRLDMWQLINAIQNSLHNRLIEIGEITLATNVMTIPSGARWNINGSNYLTASATIITIPYTATGKVRKDIFVANTSGAIVRVAGTEYEDFALRPNVPLNTILVTEVDITDSAIGAPTDPVYPPNTLMFGAFVSKEAFEGGAPRGVFGAYAFIINSTQNILCQHNGTNWNYLELNPYAELFIWDAGDDLTFTLPLGVKAKMVYVNDVIVYNSTKTGHSAYQKWSQTGLVVTIESDVLFDDQSRILITN